MKLPHIKKSTILKNIILTVLLITIGWYLKARFTPEAPMGGGAMPAPFVITQVIQSESIVPVTKYIGKVEALNRVELKPKVTGAITKVLFFGGEMVKKDDVLFIIEQDKYIANVNLAKADLAKAKAALKQAEKEYNRQKSLNKQKFASESALESSESAYLQAKAAVMQTEASLNIAQLDLEYTEVKAPISGRIGKPIITEGNIVGNTTQTLANIVQIDPIRVSFSLTEKDFLKMKRAEISQEELYNTELILSDGTVIKDDFLSRFADNEISSTTATVSIYTEYPNKEGFLIPGNYVRVLVKENRDDNSILIPQVSIAQDEIGAYTFVINKDNIANQRRLVLGDIIDDKQVVISGVSAGEKVVIQGLQKIADGLTVNPTVADPNYNN